MLVDSRIAHVVVLVSLLSTCSLQALGQDKQVNDQNGNSFMEEVGGSSVTSQSAMQRDSALQKKTGIESLDNDSSVQPARAGAPTGSPRLRQDLSNVGVPTDENGNIIPEIVRNGSSVMPTGQSSIQSYNEVPTLTAPAMMNGMPVGGFGTSYVPAGQMMAVPNPAYQQPGINMRVGPMNFGSGVPIYPYGVPYGVMPPRNLMVPVAPNGTTTYSTPFSSGSVTNTTRTFGPSTTMPDGLPDQ